VKAILDVIIQTNGKAYKALEQAHCMLYIVRDFRRGAFARTAIQAFRNRGRRQAITVAFVEDIRYQSHVEGAVSPEDMVMDDARREELVQGMSRMREDERLLINLRYYKGLPVAEVAELLGKSEAAVRKRLLRALERLRNIMKADVVG
jgi:RNA polymerase sigma factor (sigma-70 family)